MAYLTFENAGSVKVDEYRLAAPYNHIFRLDVPMHRAQGVQHPQGVAELKSDLPCLCGGKARSGQKEGKGISLYVFFQHRHHAVPLCCLHDFRKISAGNGKQLSIHLAASLIMPKNKARSVLFVLQKRNTAALTVFDCLYGFIFRIDA